MPPRPETLTPQSAVLFAILFLWQFPHFYSIAWMYKEDLRARRHTHVAGGGTGLPLDGPADPCSTALALIPVSLVPGILGMSGRIYLAGALLLGLWFLYSGVRVALERTAVRARGVLLTSVLYLPLILRA